MTFKEYRDAFLASRIPENQRYRQPGIAIPHVSTAKTKSRRMPNPFSACIRLIDDPRLSGPGPDPLWYVEVYHGDELYARHPHRDIREAEADFSHMKTRYRLHQPRKKEEPLPPFRLAPKR